MGQPFVLASFAADGVLPKPVGDGVASFNGTIQTDPEGHVFFQPDTRAAGLYVVGHNYWPALNGAGIVLLVGAVAAIGVHTGLAHPIAPTQEGQRRHSANNRPTIRETRGMAEQRVQIYTAYERFWHWLQAAAIIALLLTGIVIHDPDRFGIVPFKMAVQAHNILGFLLVANAFLGLFYYVVTGTIRQHIPEPRDFLLLSVKQARYYLSGMFRGEPHPLEKTPEQRLNPFAAGNLSHDPERAAAAAGRDRLADVERPAVARGRDGRRRPGHPGNDPHGGGVVVLHVPDRPHLPYNHGAHAPCPPARHGTGV